MGVAAIAGQDRGGGPRVWTPFFGPLCRLFKIVYMLAGRENQEAHTYLIVRFTHIFGQITRSVYAG